ncbi:MAG: diguanylate cyclase [Alphaproteobacteria bacterium]|nr:diguanylate cyclase [Alphaproteobacteria bacterium]
MGFGTMRGRLLSIVALVLAVAFIGTTVSSYHVTRDALKLSVVETELPLTGNTIYSEIQADLVQPIFISSQMANDTFLRDWVLSGEQDSDAITRYLDSVREKYGFFTVFFVSDLTRHYYHFSGVAKLIDKNDPRDEWFFRVRSMTQEYEINVDPNQQENDKTTIFINHRVYDYQNRFIGVTGVGMDLDTMAQIINRYRSDFSRTVYFIDQTGKITLHPDRSISYNKNIKSTPGLADISATILEHPGRSFEYQRDGDTILLNTRYIPELEWVLMVEQSESDATEAAGRGIFLNIIIGLIAIVLTGLAIFLAIARFQHRLEEMATTDPLTGLNNRQVFDITLRQAVERSRRSKQPMSIVMIDLDHFKLVNDRHGHLTGDEVLKSVATLLRDAVRKSDILARWGGEEFALLMENCDQKAALDSAEGLRRKLSEITPVDSLPSLKQTASFGVATLRDNEQPEGLVDRADTALYKAKNDGRNCVRAAAPISN